MPPRRSADITQLVRSLDQAFGTRGWHGTTLLGSLRGLAPETARWRPEPGRHCIWELILHTAYWKYAVRRRITGATGESFPRSPANWPAVPADRSRRSLRRDIALLKTEHAQLIAAVEGLPATRLGRRSPKGTWTYREMIAGVAAHDAYHTGQIQLIKRLR
jgi:uncharacterized damage-inducible protein DinB